MRKVKSQSTGKTSNLSNLLTLLKYDNQLMIALCCNDQNDSLLNGREEKILEV